MMPWSSELICVSANCLNLMNGLSAFDCLPSEVESLSRSAGEAMLDAAVCSDVVALWCSSC